MARAVRRGTAETKRGALAPRQSSSGAELLLADFREGLAVDAEGRGGARLQATDADLDAAGVAPAVLFVFDQLQGLVDLLDQLALAVAGAQFQAEFFFLAGAVGRIGKLAASSCM